MIRVVPIRYLPRFGRADDDTDTQPDRETRGERGHSRSAETSAQS